MGLKKGEWRKLGDAHRNKPQRSMCSYRNNIKVYFKELSGR